MYFKKVVGSWQLKTTAIYLLLICFNISYITPYNEMTSKLIYVLFYINYFLSAYTYIHIDEIHRLFFFCHYCNRASAFFCWLCEILIDLIIISSIIPAGNRMIEELNMIIIHFLSGVISTFLSCSLSKVVAEDKNGWYAVGTSCVWVWIWFVTAMAIVFPAVCVNAYSYFPSKCNE